MAEKYSIPKGTRDFIPQEMIRRNYIFQTIRQVFELYGYEPIETPAMENLSTLIGKYGEEGDRLLFKILNSGNYLEGVDPANSGPEMIHALTLRIAEKGLRYDLTVPFARFVVNHQNEIAFPFKRYQIQPVWRADKPQKGRYREFYQCDVDVIGSDSLLSEAELVQIIHDVFGRLDIRVSIRLNNRKILAGIAQVAGAGDRLTDMTVAMDKLDKIGREKVMEELGARGFEVATVLRIMQLMDLSGTIMQKIAFLKEKLVNSSIGMQGVAEMETVLGKLAACGSEQDVSLDLTLARGLNYYTGTIIEVKALETEIGSICGGGRYDDLTGIFGLPGVSGVGISFGADRIYDVLLALGRFPDHGLQSSQLLFANFGEKEEAYCMKLAMELRLHGIRTEIFPESGKLKRQMKYADQKKIPFVALVGENEMAEGKLTVKNMETGEQHLLTPVELTDLIRK
jgi:histidyl-tRNA synthetase